MFWLLSFQNNPDSRADKQASPKSHHCAFPGWVPVTLEQSLPFPGPLDSKMARQRDAQARAPPAPLEAEGLRSQGSHHSVGSLSSHM